MSLSWAMQQVLENLYDGHTITRKHERGVTVWKQFYPGGDERDFPPVTQTMKGLKRRQFVFVSMMDEVHLTPEGKELIKQLREKREARIADLPRGKGEVQS